jgi:23S rRNA pseudouridine2605 synthase
MTDSKLYRVQKLLSNYGYCSRRKAEKLIEQGMVKVNGKTITIGDKASEKDKISVDGKLINKEKKIYLIFHKPLKCVTALRDKQYKTVIDYIDIKERVFPIGRLDYNTSGLLLLTNDGDFANSIMHPRYEIKKTYLVEVDRPVTNIGKKQLEQGVLLKDGLTEPAKINIISPTSFEIQIHEGKNRIVRRMVSALGYKVTSLSRVSIGKLPLGKLKLGGFRKLMPKEMKKIFE